MMVMSTPMMVMEMMIFKFIGRRRQNGRGCEENGNKASVDKLMDPWKEEKKKQQHTARPKTACFYSTGMKPWPRERRLSHDHLQRRSKPSSE